MYKKDPHDPDNHDGVIIHLQPDILEWPTLDSILKSRNLYLASKVPSSQSYGFSSGHDVWVWELDCEENWTLKNWCFWTVVLEKTLESPLDCKEIQPVHPKGNQSWIVIGRTDTGTPIFWPPDAKNWLIWKNPWCWERLKAGGGGDNRGWDGCKHHWHNGHGFEQAPVIGDGRKPGVLQSMGSQRVGHNWVTELN